MVDFTTLHPSDFDRNLFNFLVITGSRSRVPSPVMLVADDGVMVIVMELVSVLVALVLSEIV